MMSAMDSTVLQIQIHVGHAKWTFEAMVYLVIT